MPPADPSRLSFALVVPPARGETLARFSELAAWMKEDAGGALAIEARACASYEELARTMRDGESDAAWLPPVVYAWLAERVTPIGSIARGERSTYAAALVVREDSPIRAPADLSGARAGWVDPWSAAGYVVPRLELARAGVDLDAAFGSEEFLGTHEDAVRALVRGDCDVVGTYEGAWSRVEDVRVRVLATFGEIPTDVIAVRRNLGPREYEAVARAFRRACEDDGARALVRAVFGGDRLREELEPGHVALRRAYESAVANGLFDEVRIR